MGIGIGILSAGFIAEHFSFALVYAIGGVLSIVSMMYFSAVVTPHYRRNRLRVSSNDHKPLRESADQPLSGNGMPRA